MIFEDIPTNNTFVSIINKMEETKFVRDIIETVKSFDHSLVEEDGFLIIKYKCESLYGERLIKIDKENRLLSVFTESTTTKGTSKSWNACVQYVSRINEFLYIGCFEITPDTYTFRFRTAQSFDSETSPREILLFFLEQHDYFFPKLMEGAVWVANQTKSPVEAAQLFIKPLSDSLPK